MIKKIGRLFLENGPLVAFALWLLAAACFHSYLSWQWVVWLCVVCFLGWLITYFWGKYKKLNEMPRSQWMPDEQDVDCRDNLSFWQKIVRSFTEMSWLDWLRELVVSFFLVVSLFIMHESLDSLWLADDVWNKTFCWSLSGLVVATLYWITHWLVYKLPCIYGAANRFVFIVSCLFMYLLFDFAAFTFNYFHIYSNFAETQIVEQAVKNSDEMYKCIMPIVNEKLINERAEADKEMQEKRNEKQKITDQLNDIKAQLKDCRDDLENAIDDESRASIKRDARSLRKGKKELDQKLADQKAISVRDTLAMSTAYTALRQIDSLIRQFNEAADSSKTEKRSIKRSIVTLEGRLYGALPDSLKNDSLVAQYHTIINTSSVDQSRALNDLFELLGGAYQANRAALTSAGEVEVHALLHKESIRSLALSALVDLAPILLALMAALPMWLKKRRRQ